MKYEGIFPIKHRLTYFLSSYNLRLIFPNGGTGYVGKGSVGLLGHLIDFNEVKQVLPVIKIGNFCESAISKIYLGGEHDNGRIFNATFSDFPIIRNKLEANNDLRWKSFSKGQSEIGNAVIISKDATLLSGVKVGDGAVIGAGSVVVDTVPSFSIYAGNPAKHIKYRVTDNQIEIANDLRWWDFDIEHFYSVSSLLIDIENNYKVLKENAIYESEETPTLVLSYSKDAWVGGSMTVNVLGIDLKGQFHPIKDIPLANEYFSQLSKAESEKLIWVPNIFKK